MKRIYDKVYLFILEDGKDISMYSKVLSGTLYGVEGRLITVEADVSEGLPVFNMVGVLASEVREASDRVRTALRNSGFQVQPKRITINLSPADIRKEGSVFDLPISIALLAAYGYIPTEMLNDILIIGELSLNGDVRGVKGILPIVDYAKKCNIKRIILPYGNRKEAMVVPGMEIYGVKNLLQVAEHLMGTKVMTPVICESMESKLPAFSVDFSEIKGQRLTKRATEIAVAGMHNILMMGPPGAGKSMIAKRIPSIMPELSYEESVELTKVYSVNGMLDSEEGLIRRRPFRSPHHSITVNALIGGGKIPKPGEISLAHHGVLFLDEFLEFQKNVIEMMRQPIEDRHVTISRLQGSYTFPCDFMLVAAMNPCPCGFYPDMSKCRCNSIQIERYLRKMSEPMLDRMDMCISVRKLQYDELFGEQKEESSEDIRKRVVTAHAVQKRRLKPYDISYNAQIPIRILDKVCNLGRDEIELREKIYTEYNLSARGAAKLLRVARTIADLEHCESVKCEHIWEALSYRMTDIFQKGGGI